MRKILIAVLLFMIVLNFSSSADALVESVRIEDELFEDNSISEKITIRMTNNALNSSFDFAFPSNAYDVVVDGSPVVNKSISIPLNCTTCVINISYRINNIVQSEGKKTYSLSRTLNFPEQVAILVYQIRIPNGYMIDIGGEEPSIVPQGQLKTDGSNIIVYWEERNPGLPKIYFIRYNQSKNTLIYPVLLFFLGLSIGLGSIYLFRKRFIMLDRGSSNDVVPSSLLSLDEKDIILLLQKHKGNMNQREMVRELQWSKSKVSGVLSNLDYKKVVEREKLGRNYKVRLIKRIQE